jgi:hypothetical protein
MIINYEFGATEDETSAIGTAGSIAQTAHEKRYYDRRPYRDLKQGFLEQRPICLREHIHVHAHSSSIKYREFLKHL